ncbi:MAG TPA: putative baseplate assembly protein, partial [Albitalea sp.]|nr:putative baseplate assembly protein [Albitalea sp.]
MSDKTVMPPGTETCGCCEGVAASTPTGLDNRIGLSAVAYRIGDYARFKQSMLAGLSSSKLPELAGLRTRDADDYTLGLIDAVACTADVLTFYQERLANE